MCAPHKCVSHPTEEKKNRLCICDFFFSFSSLLLLRIVVIFGRSNSFPSPHMPIVHPSFRLNIQFAPVCRLRTTSIVPNMHFRTRSRDKYFPLYCCSGEFKTNNWKKNYISQIKIHLFAVLHIQCNSNVWIFAKKNYCFIAATLNSMDWFNLTKIVSGGQVNESINITSLDNKVNELEEKGVKCTGVVNIWLLQCDDSEHTKNELFWFMYHLMRFFATTKFSSCNWINSYHFFFFCCSLIFSSSTIDSGISRVLSFRFFLFRYFLFSRVRTNMMEHVS